MEEFNEWLSHQPLTGPLSKIKPPSAITNCNIKVNNVPKKQIKQLVTN